MDANSKIQITIRFSYWYLYGYVPIVIIFSVITDRDINKERLRHWMKKALIIKVV